MDTSVDIKEKRKKVNLKDWAESFIEKQRKKYEFLPQEWVGEQGELIKFISTCSPEQCDALVNASLDALEVLTGKDPVEEKYISIKLSEKSSTYDWKYLLYLARTRDYKNLREDAKSFGALNLYLGCWLMFELAQKRLEIYADEHPNERAVVYIKYAKILEKYAKKLGKPRYLEEIDRSYKKLLSFGVVKKAETNREALTDKEKLRLELINYYLLDAIDKALKDIPIEEQIMKVAKGDIGLKYIPHAVATEIKKDRGRRKAKETSLPRDEYQNEVRRLNQIRNQVRKGTKTGKELEEAEKKFNDLFVKEINADILLEGVSDPTILKALTFDPEEFLEKLDSQQKISLLFKMIDTRDILTEREKQVLKMRLSDKEPTFEEIGKELGTTRQTANEIEKTAIKKLRLHSKHLKSS